jgi:signal transduction histidine kinase
MGVLYPDFMGEVTPSAPELPHAPPRDVIEAGEPILGVALRFIGGHHARLFRVDPDAGVLQCVAFTARDRADTPGAGSIDADLAFSHLVSRGLVPRWTADILAEPECRLHPPARELIGTQKLGARLAATIRARGTAVGSIVLTDGTGRRYSDDDVSLLSALAGRAGLAVDNARLAIELGRERREAGELALVAGLICENLDHVTVGQRIADSVLGLLGVHSAAIRLFRADGALAPIALAGRAKGYAGTDDVVPPGAGLVGRAAVEGRPISTSDIRTDPRFEQTKALRARNVAVGIVAGLAVPMRIAGAVIGVLSVGSSAPRTFARGEEDLLQRFADQAALTIGNAKTQETLRKQAERLRILHDIDLAIIAETAPGAIAEAVLGRLRDLLGVPRAIVTLFDWAAGEVEWLAAVGRHRIHRGPGVRYPLRLAGDLDALRRGEPQLVDVHALPPSPEAEALLASGVHLYMVVPMIAAGELIGTVSFGGDQAHFPDEQIDIAREVATQLAIALGQARLVERLKASYQELQQAQAQLAQSQKMEAIGQLAGGIAHDFNNLLTVIGGRSSLVLQRMQADDPSRKDVDLIQTTAQRAAALTRQLLAFSRKQVLEPKPVNLQALVAGVTPMLRRLIGEHIEVVIASGDDLGQVMADPGQLEQVIVNLVVNARDAMPDGGTLSIETANRTVTEAGPGDGPAAPSRYVTLSVRDTGCGMDAATVARIFEPFFTTKEAGKGTGLGLSTVHGIVHQSGGHLAVESAVGRGTTFTISFPRIPD